MLTEEIAKSLGFKNEFRYKISHPSFVKEGALWNKSKYNGHIPNQILSKRHVFSYSKFGKTLGLETKRYIEYCEGILLYF